MLLSTLLRIHHGGTHTETPEIRTLSLHLMLTSFFFFLFPPVHRPAIVVLLMSMVNERQPFVLRCAVLYCFQCFLYKNQKGQGEIVATLLPSTIDGNFVSDVELSTALLARGLLIGLVIQVQKFDQRMGRRFNHLENICACRKMCASE